MAASLLPTAGASVGFGGYVGATRLDTSASNQQAGVPLVVCHFSKCNCSIRQQLVNQSSINAFVNRK